MVVEQMQEPVYISVCRHKTRRVLRTDEARVAPELLKLLRHLQVRVCGANGA